VVASLVVAVPRVTRQRFEDGNGRRRKRRISERSARNANHIWSGRGRESHSPPQAGEKRTVRASRLSEI